MNPRNFRTIPCRNRLKGGNVFRSRRGDEGRQKMARPASAGSGHHTRQRCGIGRVIEHDTAGAIDLQIDETRRDDIEMPDRRKISAGANPFCWHDIRDDAISDRDDPVLQRGGTSTRKHSVRPDHQIISDMIFM